MKRRGNLRRTLPLLLARGAVVLTIGWVIFLGVAAAAGLTRILPIGTHKAHVAAANSPASTSATHGTATAKHEQGADRGQAEPTGNGTGFGGDTAKPPVHGSPAGPKAPPFSPSPPSPSPSPSPSQSPSPSPSDSPSGGQSSSP